jgi:riboflavin kinase
MELEGEVTDGLGKGRIYMAKEVYQKLFDEKLGFRPFAGTLNLEVDEKERLDFEQDSRFLRAREVYEDGKRLSDVDMTPCKIGDVECALLRLEKTDHPMGIAEVIAPVELREKFNLEDGDKVVLKYEG